MTPATASAPLAGVSAVVLDLDGTLLDHAGAARSAAASWLRGRGAAGDDDALGDAWIEVENRHYPRFERGEISHPEQRRERVRDLLPRFGLPLPVTDDEIDAAFADYLRSYAVSWRAFPDVPDALAALRSRGLLLAVLTNGVTEQQVAKVHALGLADLADAVLATDRLPAAKPSPLAYRAAQERLGVPPQEIVMVGDNRHNDVEAPLAQGWHAVWVDREQDPCPTPAGALRVRTLAELPALFRPRR